MPDEILTLPEVAQLLKVAEKTVYTMAQGAQLPAFKVRGQYVAKLLQVSLPELRVNHTGRTKEHIQSLLVANEDELGSLRPDILIFDHEGRCRGIADAKYKTTRINAFNRTGVSTDDLYQLTAYLTGFGEPNSRLDGFLIYPADAEGQVARRFAPKNPWKVASAPQRRLWFISTDSDHEVDVDTLRESERAMSSLIHEVIFDRVA